MRRLSNTKDPESHRLMSLNVRVEFQAGYS